MSYLPVILSRATIHLPVTGMSRRFRAGSSEKRTQNAVGVIAIEDWPVPLAVAYLTIGHRQTEPNNPEDCFLSPRGISATQAHRHT
jgi:hypothetical protein